MYSKAARGHSLITGSFALVFRIQLVEDRKLGALASPNGSLATHQPTPGVLSAIRYSFATEVAGSIQPQEPAGKSLAMFRFQRKEPQMNSALNPEVDHLCALSVTKT